MAFDVSSIFADQMQAVSKSDTGKLLITVDVDDLLDNDANFYAVDEDKLEDLKNSIALSGVMDPPTVTDAGGGKYRLISGHRRTAAVRALVSEGREDLRKMPVFVRSPKSAAMEELELIMANSTVRVLSGAEISKAAQRVERLLYDLKEQGVEFPGRMRDHVAAACNISRTKLANLHTIEANLIVDFKNQWEDGKLPDATALALARCEPAFQMRLRDALKRSKEAPTADAIDRVRELQKAGAKWRPSTCLHCPDRKLCPTSRDDAVLRHDVLGGCYGDPCKGELCCMDCRFGAKSEPWLACDQMCSRAQQYRTDKRIAEKQEAETKEEKTQIGYCKAIQRDAQRIAKAADAAGLPDKQKLQLDIHCYPPVEIGEIRKWAAGDFGDAYFYNDNALRVDSGQVAEVCENLHCSADYLMGLTDELLPAQSEGKTTQWRSDSDYPDGYIVAVYMFDDLEPYYETLYASNHCLRFSPNGSTVVDPPKLWFQLPKLPGHKNK